MICQTCGRDVQPHWEDYCPHFPKRLGSSGSGAATGYAGREADEKPGGAEGRSRESEAVTPGEAEEAIIQLIAKMERHSDDANEESRKWDDGEHDEKQAYQDGMAYAYNQCARWTFELLPEPDNEAQRSGRRNAPLSRPESL